MNTNRRDISKGAPTYPRGPIAPGYREWTSHREKSVYMFGFLGSLEGIFRPLNVFAQDFFDLTSQIVADSTSLRGWSRGSLKGFILQKRGKREGNYDTTSERISPSISLE